jgi:hypothetical protein
MKITTRMCPIGSMTEEDKKNFIEWVWAERKISNFDRDVLTYPRTVMLTADKENADGTSTPVLYMPVQPVLMMESTPSTPGGDPREKALALRRLSQLLEQITKDTGIQEHYFLTADPHYADFCKKHGFEKIEGFTILKRKIPVTPVTPTEE